MQYLINKLKIQNNRREKVLVQLYSMVKIPCAELGDTRTQLRDKGQGQSERDWRLED